MNATNDAYRAKIEALIAAAHAAPDTHEAVIKFSDGSERRQPCKSMAAANSFTGRYRWAMANGHQYISRATSLKISVVSVDVVAL